MENNEIKVSVYCLAYNHEKYIRKTLEGFVNQKTNFKYEVIINDDASTDNTAKIIKEYEEKYPDIIKPIYQTENQYSKNIKIFSTYIYPKVKGKYIAVCEGDDYWCNNNKLQKQYDYMELHNECSMCVHNTIKHNLKTGKETLFNNWNDIHELTFDDVFSGWNIHTTSYFFRKEYAVLPKLSKRYWFGDFIRLTMIFYYGKIIALPDVMSVYNFNNTNGLTYNTWRDGNIKSIEKIKDKKEYLIEYNKITNNKYEELLKRKISESDFNILTSELAFLNISKKDFYSIRKNIEKHECYKEFLSNMSFLEKVKFYIKFKNYFLNKLYKSIKIELLNRERKKNGAK